MFNINELNSVIENYKSSNESRVRSPLPWIQTYTKKKFFPLNPNPDDIDIVDIAHALSNQGRFSGHTNRFYSVALHSIYVSYLTNSLEGLLHDGSEAYLVDIPKPLKDSGHFNSYKIYESNLQKMIYMKFCNTDFEPVNVKVCDMIMLSTEAVQLFDEIHEEFKLPTEPLKTLIIEDLSNKEVERMFLERFEKLSNER